MQHRARVASTKPKDRTELPIRWSEAVRELTGATKKNDHVTLRERHLSLLTPGKCMNPDRERFQNLLIDANPTAIDAIEIVGFHGPQMAQRLDEDCDVAIIETNG